MKKIVLLLFLISFAFESFPQVMRYGHDYYNGIRTKASYYGWSVYACLDITFRHGECNWATQLANFPPYQDSTLYADCCNKVSKTFPRCTTNVNTNIAFILNYLNMIYEGGLMKYGNYSTKVFSPYFYTPNRFGYPYIAYLRNDDWVILYQIVYSTDVYGKQVTTFNYFNPTTGSIAGETYPDWDASFSIIAEIGTI